ncbi:hypothetical protein GH714_038985 [Hevea brasiliensis]|uniref:Disease resistance RPP13-like protein 1 n=1 Tax=Hevea brasiliensis TaxID=3981 RepID=A0A6A6LQ12_HEVBR|nr:hypothetical protein GH714_038985 [Hevea brasiliensis]
MVLGEVILAAILGMLLTRLTSPEFLRFINGLGCQKKMKKWIEFLPMLMAVLDDAEEKQQKDKTVRKWLDDLRDLAYDAEDLLDKFNTKASRRRLNPRARNFRVGQKLSPGAVKFFCRMRSGIKKITIRLQDISQRADKLGLLRILEGSSSQLSRRTPSTCLPNEPGIYGRDGDKEKVLEMVLRRESSSVDANFRVIAIVGMAGVGKTTLAKLVYNDCSISNFQAKGWVCISEEFDVKRVTKAILESITSQSCELQELNDVQVKLRKELTRKKLLLVLDDVWNKNYAEWQELKSPFSAAAPGSKIIVTTRWEDVALTMGSVPHYHKLELLSDEDCWSVFSKHAFENRDPGRHPNLELIRKNVIQKCSGLPLAAMTLGGLLRSKRRDEWENVLNRKFWNLPDESHILEALRLSYHHLPSHLKRCFGYCAVLPKGYEFNEEELVLRWIAVALYVMHDLINDLAQWAAGDTCFKLEEANKESARFKKARHSSYIREDCDSIKKLGAIGECKYLRTFLPFGHGDTSYITNHVIDLVLNLKWLRVLSFKGYNITELPCSIGKLKHLRHLDLSCTMLKSLPESTSSLFNLLFLILRDCSHLTKLPSNLKNLINLLHLDITNVSSLSEMPEGIGKLKCLCKLSDFLVDKHAGCGIEELMNLNSLRGTLRISGLENVVDVQQARQANLSAKQDLDALMLKWDSNFNDSRNQRVAKDVLNMLRPHQRLKELIVNGYAGVELPVWVGDPSFSNMVLLRLENCKNCTSLPPLGLLSSLKDLIISGMGGLKSIGAEIYGTGCSNPFPSLGTLRFEHMPEWKTWDALGKQKGEIFLHLRELSLLKCPELVGNLPNNLPSLEKLLVHECECLLVSIINYPVLCELNINGCKEVACRSMSEFSSLNSAVLFRITNFTCPTERGLMRGLKKVENLEIDGCEDLMILLQKDVGLLGSLCSMRCVKIMNCSPLVSFGGGEEEEQQMLS